MKFWKEFKEFAVKGNVMDMAVGVIIGGAFGKIVTSLVGDVIMPALSIITGKIDLTSLSLKIASDITGGEPIELKIGMFLQNVLDFLVIAFCIFGMVKLFSLMKRKEKAVPPPAAPSKEEQLLTEIRDLLKEQSKLGV